MGRAERIFLYTLLTALLLAVFGREMPRLSGNATASATWTPEELGPADALLLSGAKGELTLTNGEGRIAWSDSDTSRAWAIGAVNLSEILPNILNRESYIEEIKELEAMAVEQNGEFEQGFKALQEEYGEIGPEDPKFPEAQQRAQALMAKYNDWQQKTLQIRAKKAAEQLESAYREVIDAVEVVSDERNVDMVYRFIPTVNEFTGQTPEQAAEQIRLRTFLRYPDQIDLTEAVSEELGI